MMPQNMKIMLYNMVSWAGRFLSSDFYRFFFFMNALKFGINSFKSSVDVPVDPRLYLNTVSGACNAISGNNQKNSNLESECSIFSDCLWCARLVPLKSTTSHYLFVHLIGKGLENPIQCP